MIKCGIVGATGYTGVELLRILVAHPEVELKIVTSRSEVGRRVDDFFPSLRGRLDVTFSEPDGDILSQCDVVFFATPNGIAMKGVPELLKDDVKVIDLAADFRLKDVALWEQWYGQKHACPELLEEAVYGLPELNRSAIRDARLVANPGCYPTATVLALMPLLSEGLVDLEHLIADVKSGVSGAGRKAQVGTLMSEVGESFSAYSVQGHRHAPEIRQSLEKISNAKIGLTFVPHLLPMIRGIHVTAYGVLNTGEVDIQSVYEDAYRDEPFVDVMPPNSHPQTRSCKGANVCRCAVHEPEKGGVVTILSVIDNLVKGAAGQAVQNMNLMFGVKETCGLEAIALMP
jgi:N-acetyl-gamma-glutamyl-phosphate reductase